MPRFVSLTTAAALEGKSLPQISRDAAAGKLGRVIVGKQNRKFVEVPALERNKGRTITAEEIAAAVATTRRKRADALTDHDILARMDAGVASFYSERRDVTWHLHLQSLGITPIPQPPASEFALPMLDLQHFFTRRQVEELLAAALRQQSERWREWINSDLTHQALHPEGPEVLTIKDIKE